MAAVAALSPGRVDAIAPPPPVSAPVTRHWDGLRVHAVQSGWVAVKRAHVRYGGPDWSRLPAMALDPRWTDWLPIWSWVVEHPDGLVLVDVGETARVHDPGWFACDPTTGWVYHHLLRFAMRPEDEVGAQLGRLGLASRDVAHVVLTHLHSDHVGGLAPFAHARVHVAAAEWHGTRPGALPCRWPRGLAPALVAHDGGTGGDGTTLFADGRLRLLPTPGHSAGHQSVLLVPHDGASHPRLLLAGDVVFTAAQLTDDTVGAVCEDRAAARRTVARVRAQVAAAPTLVLPSHDPAVPARLRESTFNSTDP